MGTYDDIGLAVAGQPISSSQFGEKVRNAIIDLDARMAIREAAELLPAPVSAAGSGINSVTAAINTWQTLSPNGAVAAITNPSSDFNLVCLVFFGGWLNIALGGSNPDVRMGLNVTGGVTSDPEPGPNSPVGQGLIPIAGVPTPGGGMGMFQLTIPAGASAVTLTAQGKRSIANTAQVNYPSINIVPIRYDIP